MKDMGRSCLIAVVLAAIAVAAPLTIQQRLAQWKRVDMPFHSAGLSKREVQMVGKLVDACRLLVDACRLL